MLLPPVAAPPRKSEVSFTVATGDLARVAIMSGVIRSTVWPLASVVMEDGGRRRTSLPWIRKLVAVIGIPAPPEVFNPSCPVIETCRQMKAAGKKQTFRYQESVFRLVPGQHSVTLC